MVETSKSPLDKVDLLLKMFAWTQLLIITVAICIPSIIISLQYSGDQCVIGDVWNIRIDEWLLLSSLFQLVTIISFLPSVCCTLKHWATKIFTIIFMIILFLCLILGIFLISLSNLTTCLHDSLYVMSIIEICFIGIFIMSYAMYNISTYCKCKCGTVFDNNEDQHTDDEDISWFAQ